MKKMDYIFAFLFVIIVSLLIIPITREFIGTSSEKFPYLMGFIKTSILATYGELLASRISTRKYFSKKGLLYRFIIWGFLGMAFVLVFRIFDAGIVSSMENNLLVDFTGDGIFNKIMLAFSISFFMNLIFAPSFMILHRITDTYIDTGKGKLSNIIKINGSKIVESIDWKNFFGFVVLKTIPFFWIPAHTITFLLPENYRILSAGFLSIALGLILTLAKRKNEINY